LELDAGNIDSAVQEFESCLAIREVLQDARLIAEGHYLIGLSLCNTQQENAMKHLEKAQEILQDQHGVDDILSEVKDRIEEIKEAIAAESEAPVDIPEVNAFGAPVVKTEGAPVQDFGVVGGKKRKAETTGEAIENKKRK